MFVTGPEVVKTVTNETVTAEALGGAAAHTRTSGVAHMSAQDDVHAMAQTRSALALALTLTLALTLARTRTRPRTRTRTLTLTRALVSYLPSLRLPRLLGLPRHTRGPRRLTQR